MNLLKSQNYNPSKVFEKGVERYRASFHEAKVTVQISFARNTVSDLRKVHPCPVAVVLSCHSCCGDMASEAEKAGLFRELTKPMYILEELDRVSSVSQGC